MKPGTVWLVRRPTPETYQQVEYLAPSVNTVSTTATAPGPATRPLISVSGSIQPGTPPLAAGDTSALSPSLTAMVTAHSGLPQLVEVQEQVAPQTYRIQWLGQTILARSDQPLIPQQQHLVQLELRPDGLWLTRPAENTQTPRLLAAALLRHLPPADLAAALANLHQSLTEWTLPGNTALDLRPLIGNHPEAGEAATIPRILSDIRTVLDSFWPSEPQPLTAQQLRHLVENGGLMYEARLVSASASNSLMDSHPAASDTPGTHSPAHPTPKDAVIPNDLKGSLLRLIHTLGGRLEPAIQAVAYSALQSITALQAANVLANHLGTPYWLQVPFPDGSVWRTLYMALQPDFPVVPEDTSTRNRSPSPRNSQRFHILIHAPLDTMGNTWIDMTLQGDRLHAVLYFEREQTLQQALAMQGDLHQILQASEFTQIGVEFRSAVDLPVRHRQHSEAMRQGRPPSLHLVDWEV
jgi:hypothetical protein